MLGAIFGDIAGSWYEYHAHVAELGFELITERSRPTDDTVLTLAVSDWLRGEAELVPLLVRAVHRFPGAGYGATFRDWGMAGGGAPYGSWANGAAMRVSPCAWHSTDVADCHRLAVKSAEVTHDHPEGIRGAAATAVAVRLALEGADAETITREITTIYGYSLSTPYDEFRRGYRFDVSALGSVPQAIACALQADSFEDAIRKAIHLNGDTDTQAACPTSSRTRSSGCSTVSR
jgi:ADP-ribosylglycohydrolase